MAKRVAGLTEKLLQCAKAEFLEKGYEHASLRNIAKKAGSSKGAIYIRYPDKASLFSALVDEAADGLFELINSMHEKFLKLPYNEHVDKIIEWSDLGFKKVIDYIYQHFDEFKLLLTCSGAARPEFIHELVALDINTMKRMKNFISNFKNIESLPIHLVHLISQSFYTGLFEVVVHDMPRKEGEEYIKRLRKFFAAGWMTVLDFPSKN